MSFNAAQLHHQLAQCPASNRYWIAYSGGVDSHVLLHAMVQLRDHSAFADIDIQVVHINHQLQKQARAWQLHCRQICADYRIPLREMTINADAAKGDSPEAAARDARYAAFAELLGEGEGILLAQHKNDQAETLLLQLLRGSGPSGLAAMPLYRTFAKGWMGRPMLFASKDELTEYAHAEGLNWIEDPSNRDTDFDRNYIRQQILPPLRQRWPAVDSTLARVANHQWEASQLSLQIAQRDWKACRGSEATCLDISCLLSLTPAEQNNLLRYWIKAVNGIPVPDSKRLDRILSEVIPAADDAQPCITWQGGEVRRFNRQLYLLSGSEGWGSDAAQQEYHWDMHQPLELHPGHVLKVERKRGDGLKASLTSRDDVRIAFRQGGETCRPTKRQHTHRLKNLFQEWRIPPWRRNRIPLLYVGSELAAVVGYCICEPFQAAHDESGLIIKEQRDKPL